MAKQVAKVIGLVYFDNVSDEKDKKLYKNSKREK